MSTASIGMPWFLKVDRVQHFTDGPQDLAPEAWAVTAMDAPSEPEGCLALVDALGERGLQIGVRPVATIHSAVPLIHGRAASSNHPALSALAVQISRAASVNVG